MKHDENKFFREATLRICGSLNIETALTRVLHYLKTYMPVKEILMAYYDTKSNEGRIIAGVSTDMDDKMESIIQIPEDLWGVIRSRWENKPEIRVVNNIDTMDLLDRQLFKLIWKSENISLLSMDLKLEEERIGSLMITAKNKNQYTETHARLISLLHEPFAIAMSNILKHQEVIRLKNLLEEDNQYLHRELFHLAGDTIIGAEFGLKDIMEMVHQVAPLDSPVLLLGETGVGKEVIANAIHFSSPRKNGPLIKINCGAVPENLIDSELFGHEQGAFTGAISRKRGRFERAHTGTIFLDEIGELPLQAQIRLLRVLQTKEIERVGGTKTIPVNVRIISATHRNLEEMIQSGDFREDLWFRLNVFPITIPPLRHRKQDIPALVQHFIKQKSRDLKIRPRSLMTDRQTLDRLKTYPWPGNVRELENLVERELILNSKNGEIQGLAFKQLSVSQFDFEQHNPMDEIDASVFYTMDETIKKHIQKALVRSNGKVEGNEGAAELLDMHPSTLRAKMKRLNIPYGRNRLE